MSDSVTKKDVITLIAEEKTSSLKNHFLTFFNQDRRFVGEIQSDKILLWKTNMWISGGFPIFEFEFNPKDKLVNIHSKKNAFAKLISLFFTIPLILFFLFLLFNIDFSIASLIILGLFLFILIALYFVTNHIYNYEKKQLLIEIYKRLEIEFEEEKIKEYTIKKILLRLFMYPFSIFLIIYVLNFFPRDIALVCILLISVYMVSDIIILLKKK
ncbi:MAG TPA: hypothetical protein VKN14_03475 [Flavobacteriaceae bacterium]|nr:hypothetical protein [Flavobacteriaceae bacterium]